MEDAVRDIAKLIELVSGQSFIGDEHTNLFESGYLDSFAIANLAIEIEVRHDIVFDPDSINEKVFCSISSLQKEITRLKVRS